MQPTMMPKALRGRRIRHRERFRQSAGLVELDVDRIVALAKAGQRSAVMHALVGAYQNRPLDMGEPAVLAGRQRLFDQRDAGLGAGGEVLLEIGLRPGLVRIDDEFGIGRGLAHGGNPQPIAVAAKLDLE